MVYSMIRTRFAPSPTGLLGGLRTALLHHITGKFILRLRTNLFGLAILESQKKISLCEEVGGEFTD